MKSIATFIIMCAMMTLLAYCFVRGMELQEYVDQAAHARHMQALETSVPSAPTGLTPNYGESSAPRTHHYQDASRKARGSQ
jgi:hypothetical protein